MVNDRDVDGYRDLVTEDLVWIPPAGPPIVGRAAFGEWLRPFFGSFEYEFTTETIHAIETAERACERARFRSRMRPARGGSTQEHGGTCIVFWRRDADGVWRIERYVDEGALRR